MVHCGALGSSGPACCVAATQVSRRCYQLLLVHMTRFTYSPTGALKWKKDVSEYAEVLSSYGVPAANEDMAYLQQVGAGGWDPEVALIHLW